jgi:hypothetical protein
MHRFKGNLNEEVKGEPLNYDHVAAVHEGASEKQCLVLSSENNILNVLHEEIQSTLGNQFERNLPLQRYHELIDSFKEKNG